MPTGLLPIKDTLLLARTIKDLRLSRGSSLLHQLPFRFQLRMKAWTGTKRRHRLLAVHRVQDHYLSQRRIDTKAALFEWAAMKTAQGTSARMPPSHETSRTTHWRVTELPNTENKEQLLSGSESGTGREPAALTELARLARLARLASLLGRRQEPHPAFKLDFSPLPSSQLQPRRHPSAVDLPSGQEGGQKRAFSYPPPARVWTSALNIAFFGRSRLVLGMATDCLHQFESEVGVSFVDVSAVNVTLLLGGIASIYPTIQSW